MKKDWFKELFSDWLTNRPKLMVLSLVLAVVIWAVVALSVNSITTRTIDNIVVEIPSTGASYQSMGLDLIEGEATEHKVSVTVSGDRSIIGMLTSDSITVTPDFSNVTEAGTYNIALNASKNNQLLNYEIKTVDPSVLVLTFGLLCCFLGSCVNVRCIEISESGLHEQVYHLGCLLDIYPESLFGKPHQPETEFLCVCHIRCFAHVYCSFSEGVADTG